MAGLRISERHGHGLLVADLADQDAVGRLAQRVLQPDLELLGIGSDFALVDDRLLVGEDELDRVLEREDVPRPALVAEIEHRRERGRFARAGRADHQDQAALLHDDFLEDLRHAERIQRGNTGRDVAHHDRGRALLAESADAEAADALHRQRRIELHLVLVHLDLALGQDVVKELLHGVGRHDGLVDRHGDAVDLDVDRRAHRNEDVRRLLVGHDLEQPSHRGHVALPKTIPVV